MVNPLNGPNTPPPPPPSSQAPPPQQGTTSQDSISQQEQGAIDNSLQSLREGNILAEPKLSLSEYVKTIAEGKHEMLVELLAQGLQIIRTGSNAASYLQGLTDIANTAFNYANLLETTLIDIADFVTDKDRAKINEFNEQVIAFNDARETLNGPASVAGSINWFLAQYDFAQSKKAAAAVKYAQAAAASEQSDTDALNAQGDALSAEGDAIWDAAQRVYNVSVVAYNDARAGIATKGDEINAAILPIKDQYNSLVNQFELSLANFPPNLPLNTFGISPPELIPDPPIIIPTQDAVESSGGFPSARPVIPLISSTTTKGPVIFLEQNDPLVPLYTNLFDLNSKERSRSSFVGLTNAYNVALERLKELQARFNAPADGLGGFKEGSNLWIMDKYNQPGGATSEEIAIYDTFAGEYNKILKKLQVLAGHINFFLVRNTTEYNLILEKGRIDRAFEEANAPPEPPALPNPIPDNLPPWDETTPDPSTLPAFVFPPNPSVLTSSGFPPPGSLGLPSVASDIPDAPVIFFENTLTKLYAKVKEMLASLTSSFNEISDNPVRGNEDKSSINAEDRENLLNLLKALISRGSVSAETFLTEAGGASTGNAAASVGFASIVSGLANVRLQLVLGNALQSTAAAQFFDSIAQDSPLFALIKEPLIQAIEAQIAPLIIAESLRGVDIREFILNFTDAGSEAESLAALVATVQAIVTLIQDGRIKESVQELLAAVPPFNTLPEGKKQDILETVGNLVSFSVLYAAGQDLAAAVKNPQALLSKQLIDLVLGENGLPSLKEVIDNALESGNSEALQVELTDAFTDVLSSGGIAGDASKALAIRFSAGLFVADDPLAFIREILSEAGAGQSVANEVEVASLIILLFPEINQSDLSLEIARNFSDATSENAAQAQRELVREFLQGKDFSAPLVDQVLGLLGGDRSFASQVASLTSIVDPTTVKELAGSLRDASIFTSVSARLVGDLGDSASQALASFALESVNSVENIQIQVLNEFTATGNRGQERETQDFSKELQDEKIGPKNLENYSQLYLAALDSIWGEGLLPHNINMRTDTGPTGISIAA